MAVALPNAFHGSSLGFAVSYILVRMIGLAFQFWVSWADPTQRSAVRTFALISLGGLAAVLVGGLLVGAALYGFWGLAIVLDLVAAATGGQAEGWNIHPEHFAERHGLFVIIALGETLIVAASGVTGAVWTPDLIAVTGLAVAITCGLWWSYFPRTKPVLEHALTSKSGTERLEMARDVFSLLHFPMLCGVVAYAFVIEEAVAHPDEPLAINRATGRLMLPRVLLLAGTVVAILVLGVAPLVSLSIAFAGVALIALLEQFTYDSANLI